MKFIYFRGFERFFSSPGVVEEQCDDYKEKERKNFWSETTFGEIKV